MKQTAVEWLQEALTLTFEQQMQFEGLFQQAKQIEEQQIVDAYINGEHQQGFQLEAEQYYKETYK